MLNEASMIIVGKHILEESGMYAQAWEESFCAWNLEAFVYIS